MSDIYPTIDELTESTVMLNMRKLAGAVDKNNQTLQQNVQQAIDTANDAMEATQGFDDRISQNEQDITTLKGNVATIEEDLTNVENKNTEQDTAIEQNDAAIETEKNARIQNDITDVEFTYNPNTGSLEIQLLRGEGDLEDSVIARFIKTATLIPTSTSRAFKIRFEFYDGTSYDTNEFLIPEGGGTDVSVTGVTVVDGTTPDSFQVQIQLSDGEPLKSNDYVIDIPASENTYPTAVTGTVSGTNINIDITLNNSQHVKGTVDISTLATTQWVNTQLANYATNEDLGDIQEQLSGITISSTVSQDSTNVIKVSNAVNGNGADIKLALSIEGTDIVLTVENADGTQQATSKINLATNNGAIIERIINDYENVTVPDTYSVLSASSSSACDINSIVTATRIDTKTVKITFNETIVTFIRDTLWNNVLKITIPKGLVVYRNGSTAIAQMYILRTVDPNSGLGIYININTANGDEALYLVKGNQNILYKNNLTELFNEINNAICYIYYRGNDNGN